MRLHYSLLDEMMASPSTPLPQSQRTSFLLRKREAFDSLLHDAKPSYAHWKALADVVNLLNALVEDGVLADTGHLIRDARDALLICGDRHRLTGAVLRLDAKGVNDVRAMLEDFETAINTLPARTMIRAHRKAEKAWIKAVTKVGGGKADITVTGYREKV